MLAKSISGAAAAASPAYIEDVFSTYLYTGTGATQTITNGIDLSGKGGLVWIKGRSGATGHRLTDTARGATKSLESNSTAAEATESTGLTAFNGTGFSIGADADYNTNTATYVSWTFRKQAKFFDVVTYTGNGTSQNIAHNLGSVPGCIMVKRVDDVANWCVYHRGSGLASGSAPELQRMQLNETTAVATSGTAWNSTAPTSTQFSVGNFFNTNASGGTYVAYLFAHDAGGFGLTGTDNVISCGSFTSDSAGSVSVNIGYEPQWVLYRATAVADSWQMVDVMRGMPVDTNGSVSGRRLEANTSAAEASGNFYPTSTGFASTTGLGSSQPYIYIAIRRGPMKVPTSGTSVFSPIASSSSQGTKQNTNFPVDLQIADHRNGLEACRVFDRLRGFSTVPTNGNAQRLVTNSTDAESADTSMNQYFDNTGFQTGSNYSGISSIFWNFRRAPGFFDVVAYAGTGVDDRLVTHNLTVQPELIIAKNRTNAWGWAVYCKLFPNSGVDRYAFLNTTGAVQTSNVWSSTLSPTATTFPVSGNVYVNQSGANFVAYLFATCPGVSKVGSYTGTGTTKQIDCGFTGGARFVLIKRTDSTGDWYVWDSARGIVAGNDNYLLLNSTAAEVTNTDYIDTYSAGFEISSTAPAAINANGGTFIFLAIA